jgi:glyoxylase-like metal-dependent hydrolase (beta-lactamase superfamily II)
MGRLFVLLACLIIATPLWGANYTVEKVADGVYAALAAPGSKAASNALIVVMGKRVVIAGAHFSREGTTELLAAAARLTKLPVKAFVLTHHHRGFSRVDFDIPPAIELITTGQTWELLRKETRELKNPVTYFAADLTLQGGGRSLELTNAVHGHAEGNMVVYLPRERILFPSDLVFADLVGYMGEGRMRDWVLNLEVLGEMDACLVVPGVGAVTDLEGVRRHKLFMKDFLSEVLAHLERKEDLATTRRGFRLPGHEDKPGYREFLPVNLERAYKDLEEE